MRSSPLPLPAQEPPLQSWLDIAIAVCICILAFTAPIVLSIVATPHYPNGLIQTADMFPTSSDSLR
jgi:hypothetical protein